jgi:hypothetical protein
MEDEKTKRVTSKIAKIASFILTAQVSPRYKSQVAGGLRLKNPAVEAPVEVLVIELL